MKTDACKNFREKGLPEAFFFCENEFESIEILIQSITMTSPLPSDHSISRRTFLKSSALTVGSLSLLSSGTALGNVSELFDIEGMLCSAPTVEDVEDQIRDFLVTIPGSPLDTRTITLKLIHRCTKLDDPIGTLPYGLCAFSHMAWAEAWTGGIKLSSSPILLWEFSASYDYQNDIINLDGGLVGSLDRKKSASFLIKHSNNDPNDWISCYVEIWAPEVAFSENNGTAAASVSTVALARFSVESRIPGDPPIYYRSVPEDGSSVLKSTFVAA